MISEAKINNFFAKILPLFCKGFNVILINFIYFNYNLTLFNIYLHLPPQKQVEFCHWKIFA